MPHKVCGMGDYTDEDVDNGLAEMRRHVKNVVICLLDVLPIEMQDAGDQEEEG